VPHGCRTALYLISEGMRLNESASVSFRLGRCLQLWAVVDSGSVRFVEVLRHAVVH
jgi:hypothetical protein